MKYSSYRLDYDLAPSLLKIVVVVKALRLPHVLILWLRVSKHAPCKILLLQQIWQPSVFGMIPDLGQKCLSVLDITAIFFIMHCLFQTFMYTILFY